MIRQILSKSNENGITRENMLKYSSEITYSHEVFPQLGYKETMSLDELLPNIHTFHGIPVINYKPLSAKHEEH